MAPELVKSEQKSSRLFGRSHRVWESFPRATRYLQGWAVCGYPEKWAGSSPSFCIPFCTGKLKFVEPEGAVMLCSTSFLRSCSHPTLLLISFSMSCFFPLQDGRIFHMQIKTLIKLPVNSFQPFLPGYIWAGCWAWYYLLLLTNPNPAYLKS